MLQAATRLQDIRACVYEALSDIPEAIRQAQKYVEIYKKEEPYRLKQETVALYNAILITLQNILGFFTRTAGSKSSEAPQTLIFLTKKTINKEGPFTHSSIKKTTKRPSPGVSKT